MKKSVFLFFIALCFIACSGNKTPAQLDAEKLCNMRAQLNKLGEEKEHDPGKRSEFNNMQASIDKKIMNCLKKYESNKEEMKDFEEALHACNE